MDKIVFGSKRLKNRLFSLRGMIFGFFKVDNARYILIETPIIGSIFRRTKWDMKQIKIFSYSLDLVLNKYLEDNIHLML